MIINLTRFNPRARGGRDPFVYVVLLNNHVSIHAPAGGATPPKLLRARYS